MGYWRGAKTTRNPVIYAFSAVVLILMLPTVGWTIQTREFTNDADTLLLCHFNERDGDVVSDDATGRESHNGRIVGSPKLAEGTFGKALQFDGAKDSVDFGSYYSIFKTSFRSKVPRGTVEFWFTPSEDILGRAPYGTIVGCGQAPRIAISRTGELEVYWFEEEWNAKHSHTLKSGISTWKAGVWHNVMFFWDATGHYLVVDGKMVASDTLSGGVLASKLNVTLGAYWNRKNWAHHFAGRMDELRISRTNRYADVANRMPVARKEPESKQTLLLLPQRSLSTGDLGPYAFDFGSKKSIVGEGFIEVTDRMPYSKDRGFGWLDNGKRRGVTLRWGVSELAEDAVTGTDRAKFRVDCPAGKYRVFAVGTLLEWTNTEILVGGEKKAILRAFRKRPLIRSATFEVESKGQGIEFTIQTGGWYWALCGLVIYPAAEKEQIESNLAVVLHYLEVGSREFLEKKSPEFFVLQDPASIPTRDATSEKRGYLVSTVPIQSLLPPTVKPTRGQVLRGPLRMEIARDERQTKRVRLWTLRDLRDVRVDPGQALRSANGKTLPARAVAVTRLDYQWRRQISSNNKGIPAYNPKPYFIQYPTKMERQGTPPWGADGSGALNMVPFHINADRAQEFCVTVNVATDATPGEYKSTLLIQANGQVEEIPFVVRVLPFALSDTGLPRYRFFGGLPEKALGHKSSSIREAAEDCIRKECQFMKRWGATQLPLTYSANWTKREDPEKSIEPTFLRTMEIAQEQGLLAGPYFYMWWVSWMDFLKDAIGEPTKWAQEPERFYDMDTSPKYERFRERVTTEITMLKGEFKRRGWPEPLFGPMDEPRPKTTPLLRALANIIHKAGGKVSTQMPNNSTDFKWLEVVDRPINYQQWFNLKISRKLHERGIPNQLWRPCWGHVRISGLSRGESGLFGLYCKVDDIQYAFWSSPRLNPESEVDNIGKFSVEMTAGYSRDDGPISSLHTEVIRTGRDDARYACTVRQLIKEAMRNHKRNIPAKEIERKLNKMLNSIVARPETLLQINAAARIDWDAMRDQLTEWALELSGP